jgi:hypothetical protein
MREHTGQSLGIAGIAALGYAIWAAVLVVLLWLAVTIYAIVKWIGAPNDHPSATTLLVIVVGLVTLWPLAIALGMHLVGRSMRPSTRGRDDTPVFPVDELPESLPGS